MKGIKVQVLIPKYRRQNEDTSAEITGKHDFCILTGEGIKQYDEPTADRPELILVKKVLAGESTPYLFAVPAYKAKSGRWTFGGNYIFRWANGNFPGNYPIPVHDAPFISQD